jgi:type IV pilus assembly protein PilA
MDMNISKKFQIPNSKFYIPSKKGFTLIELLIVIGILAILASVVIIAVNPVRQFASARNSQRVSNLQAILNATFQYAAESGGNFPAAITPNQPSANCLTTATNEICNTGGTCTGLIDLSVLTTNEKYLVSIPKDPSGATANGSGYRITKSANGRITVCAPSAELGETISYTR